MQIPAFFRNMENHEHFTNKKETSTLKKQKDVAIFPQIFISTIVEIQTSPSLLKQKSYRERL